MDEETSTGDGNNGHTSRKLLDKVNVNEPIIPKWSDVSNQIVASLITVMVVVHVGLNMSFSAILLPQLEDPQNEYHISKSQASWIASLLALSTPIGSLVSGPISDKFGRKIANLVSCVPTFAAWTITAVTPTNSVQFLYLARILGGLGGGMTTAFIVYISEISHENYRAMLLSLNSLAVALGILIVTVNAVLMNWRIMALCYSVFAFVTFCLIWLFTPESPHWLLLLSNKSDCRKKTEKALEWLNPNKEIYKKTLHQILSSSRKMEEIRGVPKNNFVKRLKICLKNLMLPEVRLPLFILMGLMLLQQLSGGYAIIFYAIHIFKKFGGNFGAGIDEYSALVMLGLIRFLSSIVAGILAKFIGRKTLLYLSSFCVSVTCFVIAAHQYAMHLSNAQYNANSTLQINVSHIPFKQNKTDIYVSNYLTLGQWVPMLSVLIFVGSGAIGLLNIPWTLQGEILPTFIRGRASGFIVSFAYVIMFGVIKIYPFLLDAFNIGLVFLIQGIVCLTTILYVFAFVPETFGKSLQEIENHFKKKRTEKL